MTKKVENILKHYESDSPGVIANLARVLNHGYLGGSGKVVILPVDQGFEHGPQKSFSKNPSAYNPHYHFELAIEAGCSAYAAPLGFLEAGARTFAGQIPLILKLNSSESLYKPQAPCPSVTSELQEALRLGCVGVGFTIYPGSSLRHKMYERLAKITFEAKKLGLIVVVWSYARGEDLSKKGETALDVICYAAQIAAQLGAHIIKVKPPTDHIESKEALEIFKNLETKKLSDRVKHVLDSAFQKRRLVIFSGGASKSTQEFLSEVKELAQGGSFGSIIGRNAFQRPKKEALKLLSDVMEIYKGSL